VSAGNIQAETYVSGPVSGVWDPAGSPYIVTDDISVLEDSSLEIRPGVEVLFAAEKEVWVYGLLIAVGSADAPIRFAAMEEPAWSGLQFIGADVECRLIYCHFIEAISNGETHETHRGGAIYSQNSSPAIAYCLFEGCESGSWHEWDDLGGAIYASGGRPRILNCTFTDCRQYCCSGGGGAIYFIDTDIVISGCSFLRCSAHGYGGGVQGEFARVDVSHCTFQECMVTHFCPALSLGYCEGKIFNSLFAANEVYDESGSAIGVTGGEVEISCCTLAQNSTYAISNLGAINIYNSPATTVTNCIVWGNVNPMYPVPAQISPENFEGVQYCDVQYGFAGVGNIDLDPLFATAAAEEFFLSAVAAGQELDSPCIDAGWETAEHWALTSHTTRTDYVPDSGVLDMGFHRHEPGLSDVVTRGYDPRLRLVAAPNPSPGTTTIRLEAAENAAPTRAGELSVFDPAGRLVRSLTPGASGSRAEYVWDGRDANGGIVQPGVYFLKLEGESRYWSGSRKVVICR